jgi:small subunit ribosomal protein S15
MARQKKLKVEEMKEEDKKEKQDVEKIIIDLAKQGNTSEKIGLILKQKHNIKNVRKETGKRISEILREKDLYIDADIKNLKEKISQLEKHLSKNKHDYPTKRIFPIKSSQLRRFEKYRKKK